MNTILLKNLESIEDTVLNYAKSTDATAEKQNEFEAKKLKLQALKEINDSKDLETILYAEKFCITQELENKLYSKEQKDSLNAALKQYEEGLPSVKLVNNKQAYRFANETYSSNTREKGLPIDNFREFLKSQIARINNDLKNPASEIDKLILEQRRENIKTCVEIYKEKQTQAFTITQKEVDANKIRNIDLKNINEKDFDNQELKKALQLIKNVQTSVAHADKETRSLIVQSFCTKLADIYETGQKMPEIKINKDKNIKSSNLEL